MLDLFFKRYHSKLQTVGTFIFFAPYCSDPLHSVGLVRVAGQVALPAARVKSVHRGCDGWGGGGRPPGGLQVASSESTGGVLPGRFRPGRGGWSLECHHGAKIRGMRS